MTAPVQVAPTRGWVKVLLVLMCAVLASMWIYYFFFASHRGVYQLDDKTWRVQAKQICADAQAERLALADTSEGYITNPTNDQMLQRAGVVDTATDILERMLDDLVAIPLSGADDRARVDVFEKHYRIVLADRRRYTERLR